MERIHTGAIIYKSTLLFRQTFGQSSFIWVLWLLLNQKKIHSKLVLLSSYNMMFGVFVDQLLSIGILLN